MLPALGIGMGWGAKAVTAKNATWSYLPWVGDEGRCDPPQRVTWGREGVILKQFLKSQNLKSPLPPALRL